MERWDFLHTESMGFAFYLDPQTKAGEGMVEDDLYDITYQLQEYILNKKCITTNQSIVQLEIAEFVDAMKNPTEKARTYIQNCASPMHYWNQVGSTKFPNLFEVARIVFSIPTSQAASERVWSIYDFILSKRRNRLGPEKVSQLVQLYCNADISTECNFVNVLMGLESDVGESESEEETKE
ncbi:hypothetical protein AC1031_010052 [Aphanomyces cochlioides]|nr:hypothetical protein AC1031_010052 [Aphanomyces cochlioides]